jgi:hypothetical protein
MPGNDDEDFFFLNSVDMFLVLMYSREILEKEKNKHVSGNLELLFYLLFFEREFFFFFCGVFVYLLERTNRMVLWAQRSANVMEALTEKETKGERGKRAIKSLL